jgi:hypothetical protein
LVGTFKKWKHVFTKVGHCFQNPPHPPTPPLCPQSEIGLPHSGTDLKSRKGLYSVCSPIRNDLPEILQGISYFIMHPSSVSPPFLHSISDKSFRRVQHYRNWAHTRLLVSYTLIFLIMPLRPRALPDTEIIGTCLFFYQCWVVIRNIDRP